MVLAGPVSSHAAGCAAESVDRAFLARLARERSALGAAALEARPALCELAAERARRRVANGFAEPTFADLAQIGRGLRDRGYRAFRWDEMAFRAPETGEALWTIWARQEPATLDRLRRGDYLHIGYARLPSTTAGPSGASGVAGVAGTTAPGRTETEWVHVLLVALPDNVETQRRLEPLADLDRVRAALVEATNAARREAQLPPVTRTARLDAAAQEYADRMRAANFYGHEDPQGGTPRQRVEALGYHPRVVAENLARGFYTPEQVIERWLDSSGHRANLLSPLVREVGFGRSFDAEGENDQVVWVQVLATEAIP
jgi:uncharacterized protein YkwD